MAKRKKKPNIAHLQKIENAHQRNEYIAHLKQFCGKVSNPKVFGMIPDFALENLYNIRCQSFRMQVVPGQDVPNAIYKDCKFIFQHALKNSFVHLGVGEVDNISLHDYFTFGLTLILYANRIKEDEYPNAPLVKQALAPLAKASGEGIYEEAWKQFQGTLNTLSVLNGNITEAIYAFKLVQHLQTDGFAGVGFSIDIYALPAEVEQIAIEGKSRPAYHLGWAFAEPAPFFDFIKIKSEDIKLQKGFPLDVYVQEHALIRLSERMDGVDMGCLHFGAFESFKVPKVFTNKKGDLLFEFRFFGIKTGYFKADVIDGRIILRTFLFLTNNGTPEGEKLHANTGIQKEDKMYLTIDKLSTFVNSDIATNPKVKQMFIDAGCESLFNFDKSLYFSRNGKDTKERNIAHVIATYMGLDNNPPAATQIKPN